MRKKVFSLFIAASMAIAFSFTSCKKELSADIPAMRNLTPQQFTMASLTSTDKFGEKMNTVSYPKTEKERYVGIFYWMWISNTNYYYHGIYDCTKIMSTEKGQAAFWNIDPSMAEYQKISKIGAFHFTNEPMYGYYNSSDPWVITKHMEMLMLAGIDYIFLDTSNAYIYKDDITNSSIFDGTIKAPCYTLLDTMLDLYNKGWNVPKVVFLTNYQSGTQVSKIRNEYFESGKYDALWFRPNGVNPMIIGTTAENQGASDMYGTPNFISISQDDQLYFDVKETQWPSKAAKPNGFPWICSRYPNSYHSESKAISVSVAQHGDLGFTDMVPRSSRGYDAINNTICEDWEKGQNFENQWKTVFNQEAKGNDVMFVQVTGWNEWIGMKFNTLSDKAVMVDNFYGQYTRDLEPDRRLYQDTTMLQLARNVKKYKYANVEEKYLWPKKTISAFSDYPEESATYLDPMGDAINRDYFSFDVGRDKLYYSDHSARNDIIETKVIHDDHNIYFLVKTKEDITAYDSTENWMNILIGNSSQKNNFGGYQYIINRSVNGNVSSIEKSNGGWKWEKTGNANLNIQGNLMLVTVPMEALGMDKEHIQFDFKISDNVIRPEWYDATDAEHDILYYYITGDSAPLGRYSYSYGYNSVNK